MPTLAVKHVHTKIKEKRESLGSEHSHEPHAVLPAGEFLVHLLQRHDRLGTCSAARDGANPSIIDIESLVKNPCTISGEMGIVDSRVCQIKSAQRGGVDYGARQRYLTSQTCTIDGRTTVATHWT
jgi:hypothetical protein